MIDDERTCQTELDRGQDYQSGPAIGGLWGAQSGRRPLEDLFEEAKGVFNGEPSNIDPPNGLQIRQLRSPPPEGDAARELWSVWAGAPPPGGAPPTDQGTSLARSSFLVVLWDRMQPAPALAPYLPIACIGRIPLNRRPGQMVGSSQTNLAPCLRGRPSVGPGDGSAEIHRPDRRRTRTLTSSPANATPSCTGS
jgi:hypothetical protein